jgi:hypothetical protein
MISVNGTRILDLALLADIAEFAEFAEHTVEVAGLSVRCWRGGGGTPVVFLHGPTAGDQPATPDAGGRSPGHRLRDARLRCLAAQ